MKDKKILYGIMIAFVFLLSIGLTYAYFSVTTAVVGDRNDIKASVGTLNILYTDGPEIVAENIEPGWTTTKTVKVKNTGTLKAYYSLIWSSLTNEIENDELVLSGVCTSDKDTCEDIPTQVVGSEEIVYGVGIDPNEEHTYVITFTFIETGSAQNYNQEKTFNGVLNVVGANEAYTLMGMLQDSNGDPIGGATVEIHSTLRTGVTDPEGNFEIRGVELGSHEVNVISSGSTTLAVDSIQLASGSMATVDGKSITALKDKEKVNLTIKLNNSSAIGEIKVNVLLKDKILSDNTVYRDDTSSPYVTASTGVDFTAKSTHTNGQGLYTNNKLEDGKNTYFRGGSFCAYLSSEFGIDYTSEIEGGQLCTYFGGEWNNTYKTCSLNTDRATCQSKGYTYYDLKNNVTFAGHKWRIIRIDENNNIRMILADTSVSETEFNSSSDDNAYFGYMYGDISLFGDAITSTTSALYHGPQSYYYSTTYARNASNAYYLTGDMVSGVWNTESICTSSVCPVANYYTCKSTSSSGTCSTLYKISSWLSSSNANAYTITYESQSYELAHQNINNSTIKTYSDNWYNANLSSYSNYLADAGYCNDRSISSGLGYGKSDTLFGRVSVDADDNFVIDPRLNANTGCSNASRDLFTTSTSVIGNKKLTNPIGLITVDEAMYAGMVPYGRTFNFTNYLKFNDGYWTMSLEGFSASQFASVFYVHYMGTFYGKYVHNTSGFRPSISLKPNTSVTSGTGTYDDPYVIQ